MKTLKVLVILLFPALLPLVAHAQQVTGRGTKTLDGRDTLLTVTKTTVDGDTMKVKVLGEVEIVSLRTFKNKRDQRRYDRLVKNVKKVYPYAKAVGERMLKYNEAMQNLTRRERKEMVKAFEREVREEKGAELAALTPNQGRILLKLIDRETQHTPYEIVEDLRGSVQAFILQTVAGFFDFDLKEEFSPSTLESDKMIDEICLLIDRGQI